jgi:hypothetical protein
MVFICCLPRYCSGIRRENRSFLLIYDLAWQRQVLTPKRIFGMNLHANCKFMYGANTLCKCFYKFTPETTSSCISDAIISLYYITRAGGMYLASPAKNYERGVPCHAAFEPCLLFLIGVAWLSSAFAAALHLVFPSSSRLLR